MHLYGFSLMWMRMWNPSAFLGAVAKLHCVQSCGFSPECKLIWCPNSHCCFCCSQIVASFAFIWVFSRPARLSVSILRYEVGKGLTAVQFSPVWAIRWVFRFSARKVSGLSGQAEGSFFPAVFFFWEYTYLWRSWKSLTLGWNHKDQLEISDALIKSLTLR